MDRFIDTIREEALQHIEKNDNLYLYGSRARNDNGPDSDWDLLFLTGKDYTSDENFEKYIYPLVLLGQKKQQEISVLAYSKAEWKRNSPSLFYLNVMNDKIKII